MSEGVQFSHHCRLDFGHLTKFKERSIEQWEHERAARQMFLRLSERATELLDLPDDLSRFTGCGEKWLLFLHREFNPEKRPVAHGAYQVIHDVHAASERALNRWISFTPSELQKEIIIALEGKVMTADCLQAELNVSRHTLYGGKNGKGGLNELKGFGKVSNDRKVGGYFRPDAPPP